jgi:L-rhamnose isomerase
MDWIMNSTLIEFYDKNSHPQLIEFIEAIVDRNLLFRASSLESIFKNMDEINRAVEKAVTIYYSSGMSIPDNFKMIYISDGDKKYIIKDWMLSKQAFCLVMLNGDPSNLNVGRIQLEILNRLF